MLYQIVEGSTGAPPAIEFLADLDPFEKRAYKFARAGGHAAAATDLKIQETSETIRLVNSRIGISIRKKLVEGLGPIEGIRLPSGQWIGNSRLLGAPLVPSSYSVSLVARGPVFAEIICDIRFAEARSWQLRLRIMANEPVVLVDEKFSQRFNLVSVAPEPAIFAGRLILSVGQGRFRAAKENSPPGKFLQHMTRQFLC